MIVLTLKDGDECLTELVSKQRIGQLPEVLLYHVRYIVRLKTTTLVVRCKVYGGTCWDIRSSIC